jgi:biopolymer transport protein ExbB
MDFTVLVRLHSGNFDFTRVKENGEDLRFVNGDDTTLLKYHIEMFDAFDEIALVWVKIPDMAPSSNQNSIWIYYGNETAVSGQDSKNSFDALYQAVYHFNEFEGTPQDAASYSVNSSEYLAGQGLAGVIGNGATFSGAGHMKIPDNPALVFDKGLTFSTWIKIFQEQDDAWLFHRSSGDKSLEQTTDLPLEGWHHLAVTIDPDCKFVIYLDGAEAQWMNADTDLSGITGDVFVGGVDDGTHYFSGDMDELRISGISRPGAWIRGLFTSQGPAASLCSYAIEEINESSGGMPVFYLATIFKNITIDGLVIIGLLLVLSGISWMVMISKGVFLFSTAKGNKTFLNTYRQAGDPVELSTGINNFNGSGLYRIYENGCKALDLNKPRTAVDPGECDIPEDKPVISKVRLDTFKATLEQGLIDESKRMNAWLLVLTMSISGGPFLGLLGTVWGVMNTFAAMAEAGEANIMAIAPGVASALSTTVFGLIVAIPALFGYNYLAGRIRDITADSGIFVDQFALKVASVYGEKR